jgi:glucuronokinase
METQGHGHYEELAPSLLPPLYIAYTTNLSEGTEVFHNDIRGRFERGDKGVLEAMEFWADLARQTRDLLKARRGAEIGPLLDANFDRRRQLYEMSEGNIKMVETARAAGATAKFTGSGGAIVGTYPDETVYQRLVDTLSPLGMEVFKPIIAEV